MAEAISRGAALAGVAEDDTPPSIAKAVDAAIRRARGARTSLTEGDVTALGALWGKAVADGAGWTWAQVEDGDQRVVCVVPNDHALACPVFAFMSQQANGTRETTVLLLFNMIVAGEWPDAKSGQLSFVT